MGDTIRALDAPPGDTICALATPSGEGAIGIIRISGPAAREVLRRLCPGVSPRPRRLLLGAARHPTSGELLDRVLVCFMPGPRSYTGEDTAEVHGHGGAHNMRRLLAAVVALGARPAGPGEFTRRAFLRGRLDLTQAEAVMQVIAARSERALHNAQRLLQGELGGRVRDLRERVIALEARLEACVDFAEDAAEAAELSGLSGALAAVEEAVRDLARGSATARLQEGARVALVGPVNVGKSSLFNALLGEPRALVSAEPGTTRDYLEGEVIWSGQRLLLLDGAGTRPAGAGSALERAGSALLAAQLESCDLLLCVEESAAAARPLPPPTRASLLVINKVDLLPASRRGELEEQLGGAAVLVSARTGEGLPALRQAVQRRLDRGESAAETLLVASQRQHQELERAGEALAAGRRALVEGLPPELVVEHLREAREALGAITGESYREEVLDAIFSRFCLGK